MIDQVTHSAALLAELARFRDGLNDARQHVEVSRVAITSSSRALRRVSQRERMHEAKQAAELDRLHRENPTADVRRKLTTAITLPRKPAAC